MQYRLISWFAETPVHAGTGQTTGTVDLPIQRERHTGYPILPATSLKGALRQAAMVAEKGAEARRWFGPETGELSSGNGFAGCVAFSDARVAAFPVRSLYAVFVWVTCPLVLSRLKRDLQRLQCDVNLPLPAVPVGEARRIPGSGVPDRLALEDLPLAVQDAREMTAVRDLLSRLLPEGSAHEETRGKFARHLLLLSDEDYRYLVENACPVEARNQLDAKTKTSNNLWYEESLPPETLLYSLVLIEKARETSNGKSAEEVAREFEEWLAKQAYFQLGGNETVGEGWCAARILTPVALGGGS